MKPYSYISITSLSTLMSLYLVHLNCKGSTVQAWQGIHTKVSCFHISSHLKKECKQVLVKKGYIGFVGSQPMLLLFDACRLNIWCKSNNIGCDPTNPM